MGEMEMQARFEDWLPGISPMDSFVDVDGCIVYVDRYVQGAWLGWQFALSAAPQVPDGWVLVPAVPTPQMVRAGAGEVLISRLEASKVWAAMLAAKPDPRA